MVRQHVHPRITFAALPVLDEGGAARMRQSAAASWPRPVRVLLAPLALAAAVLGGALFAILLPICGIATMAEGLAKGAWAFVRGALSQPPRR